MSVIPSSALSTTSFAALGAVLCIGSFVLVVHRLIHATKGLKASGVYPWLSPPREQTKASIVSSKTSTTDYSRTFPPSQRSTLPDLSHVSGTSQQDVDLTQKRVLKLTEDYRTANSSSFVFSGFSVGEVRALGLMPDYEKLSGFPLPSPLCDFELEDARPRPYRPFRWAYHQTMSFQKLDPDFWLEIESTYVERIRQRQSLFANVGKEVLQALPGSELACKELMEMALQFYCARYPKKFEVKGTVLVNHLLGTEHDLAVANPLHVLLDNVPEDFGIMLRDHDTGRYQFRAGIICSSIGWSLGTKIGLGLPGIHAPVPDYKEKMELSMDRFFTKIPTYNPIQRGSWGLEIGEPLYLPADHPDFGHRDAQDPSLRPDDLTLRVDWQTLRRLPLSGAVVFNFKALFTPLPEFKNEPYIPSLVLKILNEGKENLMKYKGTWHVEHVAKPALEEYEQFQLDNGMIEENWTHHTLEEYPFFKGWDARK